MRQFEMGGGEMTKLTDEELAERGWSRCSNCGAIRSPFTGLDFHNHATEDCIYSQEAGFTIIINGDKFDSTNSKTTVD